MNREGVIEDEELELDRHKKELERLNKKWFKFSKTTEFMEFLEFYCKEKEIFINKLLKGG